MTLEDSPSALPSPIGAPSPAIALSPWVNEQFPAWEELLTAHDVARLTRRPRWLLKTLALLGRFPHKRRYHGRGIGWLRTDVAHWLAKDLRAANDSEYLPPESLHTENDGA
jgi:predicted DNA-binding transcriptional regulator AlpA